MVADLVTTELALKAGAREANPIMQGGTVQRIAITSATTAAVLHLSKAWERDRPQLVKWGLRVGIAAGIYLAGRNIGVAVVQSQR